MKHKKQEKCGVVILFLIGILMSSTLVLAAEQSIELIDVSTGDTEEDSACIFKVNGKTVVVDRRDKVTVDGITIYVQEVYSVNSESKTGDRCEFIYSGLNDEEEETEIKQEIIGEKIVEFYFETAQEEQEEIESDAQEETTEKTIGDNTVVRISGYDVTGLSIDAKDDEEKTGTTSSQNAQQEKKGIFAKILSWIFG